MLHDEDDDLFGLWMFRGGALVEVGIPGTQRVHIAAPPWDADPGFLVRTGLGRGRTGTRQSTYKTRGRAGDPAQTGAGQVRKSPLPVLPGAGPVGDRRGAVAGAPAGVERSPLDGPLPGEQHGDPHAVRLSREVTHRQRIRRSLTPKRHPSPCSARTGSRKSRP